MKSKILFFIAGPVPTEAEREQAAQIVGNVVFRNAIYADDGSCEQCDGVAGLVPESYSHLPVAESDSDESGDEEETARKAAEKAARKAAEKAARKAAKAAEQTSGGQQTPLIPSDTNWKPNA